MFLGHFALAMAGKRVSPRTSLGTLVAAAQLPDLLWPIFLLLGWETVKVDPGNTVVTPLDFVSYPISHSLLTMLGWGLLFGVVYRTRTGNTRGAVVVAALVASHWLLDFIAHRPDLPLYPGSDVRAGLGLWNSLRATVAIEVTMLAAGIVLYRRTMHPKDAIGLLGFGIFAGVLALLFAANLGQPPPNERAVAWVTLGLWLFPFWAAWADRHCQSNPGVAGRSTPGAQE